MNVFPGAASLLEQIDKKIMVWLRDGRTFVGHLRSVDQFANLVLYKVVERIQVGKEYGDIPHGILVVRGENVALLGEVDEQIEDNNFSPVDIDKILAAEGMRREFRKVMEALREKSFRKHNMVFGETTLDLF